MPEYLAPGVYVEEVSFRPKSIEGVSTSTTAFVGPTRKGPLSGTPEVITSFGEFERIFGGLENLSFTAAADAAPNAINYVAHAVRAFFDNGGARLYFARTFAPRSGTDTGAAQSSAFISAGGVTARFVARMSGSGLNGSVAELNRVAKETGSAPALANVGIRVFLKETRATAVTLAGAPPGSLVRAGTGGSAQFFGRTGNQWLAADGTTALDLAAVPADSALVTMTVQTTDADDNIIQYEDLGFDPAHPRYVGEVLRQNPTRRADELQNPYYLAITGAPTAFDLRAGLFTQGGNAVSQNFFAVTGGNDGAEPPATDADAAVFSYSDALDRLESIDDISIVAAPGHSALAATTYRAVQQALISHAERMRYRVAVLDTRPNLLPGGAREDRSFVDSTYAALYYPWVVVANPLARPGNDQIPKEISLPPSGFVCGIYARTDIDRGVWKAPANEVVRGALRFEPDINRRQQEVLNPEGVNCLRSFYGRGLRVWGGRTASSDPEWKYVNVRRYFIYLEHSIDRSTQWAVFEPNGEALWANSRETVSAFLYNEWRSGALLGATPEEAFFVRCDRSTMTQNDLDNGRLICLIGVAALKPAEFVIFRIGQKTADARS
jgi:phage tail sheath protein FI